MSISSNQLKVLIHSYKTHFAQYEQLIVEQPVKYGLLAKIKQKGKVAIGLQGYQDKKRAKELEQLIKMLHDESKKITEYYIDGIKRSLEKLKKQQAKSIKEPIKYFLSCLKKIYQKNKKNSYKIFEKINVSPQMQQKFQEMSEMFQEMAQIDMSKKEIAGNTAIIGTLGTLTAASVPAAVTATIGAVATASTGTAISSLSGAAATNANIDWLGGGSIASGGGGVALGSAVLGGIQIGATGGIALLATGLFISSYYSNQLTKSTKRAAEIVTQIKSIEAHWPLLEGQIARIKELIDVTSKLFTCAQKNVDILQINILNFNIENKKDVEIFQKTAILVKALIDIIQIPLFDKNGALSVNGTDILKASYKVIENNKLI
ncbi:MAG: hypothetical protein E7027_05165 [Elusimicrobium sp.]|uniref:Uncharacterized protein n=1 Tax=Candidatus Avelusimicrobium gallicola TaxID=2562704 RepID=A0A928DQB2_9BACT|nr:hypothetical protein [Elusimicrobium sp.]